jgi:hypothetical protein
MGLGPGGAVPEQHRFSFPLLNGVGFPSGVWDGDIPATRLGMARTAAHKKQSATGATSSECLG